MTASADRSAAQTSTHAGSEPVAARTGLRGLTFRRLFTDGVTHPFDAIEWELRTAAITNDKGEVFFEQKDVEVPKFWSMTATNIVTQKYFSGRAGTPERERSVRQLIGRVVETITGFGSKGGYFRTGGGPGRVPRRADGDPREPGGELQLPRLVQRRRRGEAAGLGLLHQRRRRLDGLDPRPGQDRGDALQVRLRDRLEPLLPPLLDRVPLLRRHRLGPRLVHEGLRQLRRRHQVGRQDAPRREDGHPERRPPRRPRVHRLQGEGGAEGLGPHRGGLGRLLRRRGLQQRPLPEREPHRPRDGRVHAGRGGRAGSTPATP